MLVDPAALLDDCERAWHEAGAPDAEPATSQERTALVVEALVAYRLLADACGVAADTVFARWPACTVYAVAHCGGSPELARQLTRARRRVVRARPDLAAAGGAPRGASAHDWEVGAEAAARALGWPWPRPPAAAPPGAPGTPGMPPRPPRLRTPPPAPELRLGPGGGSVVLTLASGEPGSPGEVWRLSADGRPFTACPPQWTLPGPVRRIEAADPGGRVHLLPVVDPDTALLAFAPDGRLLPPGEPLPAGELRLLHAGELLADHGELTGVEFPTPYGWDGWTLSAVSLAGIRRLRASHGASRGWLAVAAGGPLGWEGGTVLSCVTGAGHAPVWNRPPALRLPLRPGEPAAARWRAEVRRPGHETVLAAVDGAPGTVVDPWGDVPRPLLGPYEVRVRREGSPAGRRLTAFLAEGLTAAPAPEWRRLTERGGLAPAQVAFGGDGAVAVSRRTVSFTAYEVAKPVVLRAATGEYVVEAAVAHSEVRLETDGGARPWSVRPLDIDAADLAPGWAVTVRLPEEAVVVTPELALVIDGTAVHTVRPERRARTRRGDLRYPLSALADTVRDCPAAELRLLVAGDSLLLGRLRTRPIAEGVRCDGPSLLLRGLRHPGELTARLHMVYAPWRQPLTVPVDPSGRIPLPDDWRSAGPLLVRLRANTGFRPDDALWPDLRDRDTLVLRDAPWTPGRGADAQAAVSAYLAGQGPLPEDPEALVPLWLVAARGRDLRTCGARATTREDALRALGLAARRALYAAAGAGLRSGELAAVVVGSGLAALRVRRVDDPGAVRTAWRTAPVCALLLSAPLLPYLSGHASYDSAELYPREAELLEEAAQFLGDSATRLLAGQGDPSPSAGRFDAQARALDGVPAAQRQAMWRTAHIVPRALLDADTRAAAAWQAFHARRDLARHCAARDAGEWLDAIGAFLDDGHRSLARAFRHRDPGPVRGGSEAWLRAPFLSLGGALLARLAAGGDGRAVVLERRLRPLWAAVASYAPGLAAVDLALAECLVASEHARRAS